MPDQTLITKKSVHSTRPLKANQRQSRREEKRKRLIDFRTKIYRIDRLVTKDLLDFCDKDQTDNNDGQQLPGDQSQILSNIRASQVSGMSGSGFPSVKKIETACASTAEKKYLVINSISSDPALLHDDWLLEEKWKDILTGIHVLQKCLAFEKIIIATRNPFHPQVTETSPLSVKQLDFFYPLGEEHILINRLLGIPIGYGEIPAEYGILVFNVQTVFMIGQAAMNGRRIPYRYLTAANLVTGEARIVRAPIGTSVSEVLYAAFEQPKGTELFAGDGAMNCHQITKNERICESTNAIFYAHSPYFSNPSACIGCGKCQKKCPVHLPVAGIMKTVKYGQTIPREISSQCLGCNACTYFCSAGIDTAHYMR